MSLRTTKVTSAVCNLFTGIIHSDLHRLNVPERINYKLRLAVFKCLNGSAQPYLSELCISAAQIERRRHLRYAALRSAREPSQALARRRVTLFPTGSRKLVLVSVLQDRSLKTFLFAEYGTTKAL